MNLIDKLLARMTLDEKLGQLNMATAGQAVTGPVRDDPATEAIRAGKVGALLNLWGREATARYQKIAVEETRLAIPLLFGADVLHGHRTTFPIPLAEAGLFDPQTWERTARAAAVEAAADGIALTFAPMLDIARDPRWGRIAEGPGEDPLVGALFAEAKVRGFQGGDLAAPTSIAATAKHFCAGGAAIAGLEYGAVDVSERTLREVYLPPFRAAVEAGCAAIMPAFNSVAGIPMTSNAPLLRDCLRRELGFDGMIVSDYDAIAELPIHGVAADLAEAAALALKAGVDMDMVSGVYHACLPEALARGLVGLDDIDAAVRRVLTLKRRLGLFDDPYRHVSASSQVARPEVARPAKELAADVARRAITLLTNRGVLPLAADLRRIAVIGPLADAPAEMLGPWSLAGEGSRCVTILQGLRAALPHCEITFAAGVSAKGHEEGEIAAASDLCAKAELVILCVGETADMSGEASSRAAPGLPGRQRALAEAVLGVGVPVVAVISSGRPLMIAWLAERAHALVATWFLGDAAGHAVADVLTGRFNPTGRLAVTWPREVGQIPIFHAARAAARPADPAEPFSSKYIDLPVEPLFSFGHGLSYARVTLRNLRAARNEFFRRDRIELKIDVVNQSTTATEETIFLFAHDLAASSARPLLELKSWAKVALAPREARTVALALPAESLCCLNENFKPVLEPGEFDIFVGLSADRKSLLTTRLRALAGPAPRDGDAAT
ncbi:MAG: glycoside hydrolase family 3 N-terminal domain-containing protein [Rhodoblastus sp.]|uniref:glycoside hydrolase family 3 N-terminal domain-containing protein n=1 Tax=Rhodoblastus sp. TaxID=1962975 RepID=UPI003F9DE6D7